MPERPPLPLFENPGDARRYVAAFATIAAGLIVLLLGAVAVAVVGGPAASLAVVAGACALGVGQGVYLSLCHRVWVRHRPSVPWDWNSARAFHEGSFVATYRRAWRVARAS